MTTSTAGLDLAFNGVAMRFATPGGGEVAALGGVELAIGAGSFVSLIGPNGCGKSTLLRIAAGLLSPTAGSVTVGGTPPSSRDGRVALAFQQPRLVPWRSTLDNVALPLEVRGVPVGERRRRAEDALERVGLASAASLRPAELSGGMAQRAALARALVSEPAVLLLDEPFSALDALTREAFNAELQGLWIERRCTVVLVTHSVTEAVALADRVVVMTPRPGTVATVVEVDLDRPRPPLLLGDARAAAYASQVREALHSRDADLRPWRSKVPA